jgi:hypothetical protein
MKLEKNASMKPLNEEFEVGSSTIYALQEQTERLLKFYAKSDVSKLMHN